VLAPPPIEPLIVREEVSIWSYIWVALFAAALTAAVLWLVAWTRQRRRRDKEE
jgi:hypothetical protein